MGPELTLHMACVKKCLAPLAFALVLLSCLPSPAAKAQGRNQAGAPVSEAIRALAADAARSLPGAAPTYDERDWLERFYAPRGYAPAWLDGGANANAAAAIEQLQGAGVHGLAAADYHADALAAQLRAGLPQGAARFEAGLTAAMLRYLADLRVGRVRSEFHSAGPDPRLRAFDPVEQLRAAIAADAVAAVIEAAEPRVPFYRRIKAALAQYRLLAEQEQPLVPAPVRRAGLKPGDAYAGAPALRERLVQLGDLAASAAPAGQDTQERRYTRELAEALRGFQQRHGLRDDGILGRSTVAALNVPLAHRVRQLELTLERLRWLPDFAPGPMIAVNLPAYRLWAFDTGAAGRGAPEPGAAASATPAPLEMRVIVGTAAKTPTPLFVGQMRYLEFNPYWNVPRSIERAEIIPKLESNPAYLEQNGMELVPLAGAGAPTATVDAATLEALRAGKYRVRQRPGPRNALGAVKFALPNPMSIYLHSTPARALFKRTRRDLSHGCIRVENPQELAQFVLRGQPQWNADSIGAAMAPGLTRTVKLAAPIPVVLFYATAVLDREGRALFSADVYRRDPLLERTLTERKSAPLP